jgi:hypothetical protein
MLLFDLRLIPVFIVEFILIFCMLRGKLIPWDTFILTVQCSVIYLTAKHCLPKSVTRHSSPVIAREGVYV